MNCWLDELYWGFPHDGNIPTPSGRRGLYDLFDFIPHFHSVISPELLFLARAMLYYDGVAGYAYMFSR